MGRSNRRKLINIQNLNGGSEKSSSKRRKTTGNSDLEVMGKENVRFYLQITEFSPYKFTLRNLLAWHREVTLWKKRSQRSDGPLNKAT